MKINEIILRAVNGEMGTTENLPDLTKREWLRVGLLQVEVCGN